MMSSTQAPLRHQDERALGLRVPVTHVKQQEGNRTVKVRNIAVTAVIVVDTAAYTTMIRAQSLP